MGRERGGVEREKERKGTVSQRAGTATNHRQFHRGAMRRPATTDVIIPRRQHWPFYRGVVTRTICFSAMQKKGRNNDPWGDFPHTQRVTATSRQPVIISSLHIRRRSTRVCQCLRFLEETQLPAALWSLYRVHESILDWSKLLSDSICSVYICVCIVITSTCCIKYYKRSDKYDP